MVIDATMVYSGPQVTGYVVLRFGGTSPDCPNYYHEVTPQMISGEDGDTVMLFGFEVSNELYANPPNWLTYAMGVVADVEVRANGQYDVMLVDNWYLYDGSEARSVMTASPIPVAQLEAEVEAAVGGP